MANSFRLEVRTPSQNFYSGEVEEIIATTLEGQEGFMAGHSWACKLLDAGKLQIKEKGSRPDEWKIAAMAGGFIDIKDTMVIYADAIEWDKSASGNRRAR